MESKRNIYRSERIDTLRITLIGTSCAVVASVLINYLLLFSDTLTPFGRSLATAIAVPILVGVPLSFLLGRAWIRHRQAEHELTRLASFDRVTSCLNGPTFSNLVERRMKSSNMDDCVFVTVELEHLRELIANYGSACGEETQRLLAATIQSSVRAGDLVSRTGEGQFGILLQNVSEPEATGICRRIHQKISDVYLAPGGKPLALDVRIAGVNVDGPANFDMLFHAAYQQNARFVAGQPLLPLSQAEATTEVAN